MRGNEFVSLRAEVFETADENEELRELRVACETIGVEKSKKLVVSGPHGGKPGDEIAVGTIKLKGLLELVSATNDKVSSESSLFLNTPPSPFTNGSICSCFFSEGIKIEVDRAEPESKPRNARASLSAAVNSFVC